MAVVVRGHVRDRPFARTVYAIAAKRFSGDLVLGESGRAYKVTWQQGAVVAAESAWPGDSPGRIALTAGLVNSTELAGILRAVQASPGADQLAVLTRMARLTAEQVEQIGRRALVQQALRIFALADASFVLDSEPTGAAGPARIDARWLIYHGVRTHYSEERLASDLAAVRGASFRLVRTAAEALAPYGFDDAAQGYLRELAGRAMTLDELAGASRAQKMSKKDVAALLYALLATDAVIAEHQAGASQAAEQAAPAKPAEQAAPVEQAAPAGVPVPARQMARAVKVRAGKGEKARQRAVDPSRVARIRELIATKIGEIDAGASHYEVLGVTRDAGVATIRSAYFELAKHLHPDRLRAAGVTEKPGAGQRLFARINEAFAVLGHAAQRAAYDRSLGHEASGDAGNDDAESMAARLVAAEQHFLRGEMALRRNQFAQALAEFEQAVELNPDDAEHHALLAWSRWCAAPDKAAVHVQVEDGFKRAMALSRRNVAAHFYRGQVASITGDLQVALSCFRTVLDIQPEHREATLQVRLLQSRLGAQDDRRKGLLDRLKRR